MADQLRLVVLRPIHDPVLEPVRIPGKQREAGDLGLPGTKRARRREEEGSAGLPGPCRPPETPSPARRRAPSPSTAWTKSNDSESKGIASAQPSSIVISMSLRRATSRLTSIAGRHGSTPSATNPFIAKQITATPCAAPTSRTRAPGASVKSGLCGLRSSIRRGRCARGCRAQRGFDVCLLGRFVSMRPARELTYISRGAGTPCRRRRRRGRWSPEPRTWQPYTPRRRSHGFEGFLQIQDLPAPLFGGRIDRSNSALPMGRRRVRDGNAGLAGPKATLGRVSVFHHHRKAGNCLGSKRTRSGPRSACFCHKRTDLGHTIALSVAGELDAVTAPQLQAAILAANTDCSRLVVNLSELTFIDSIGLGILLGAKKLSQEQSFQLFS